MSNNKKIKINGNHRAVNEKQWNINENDNLPHSPQTHPLNSLNIPISSFKSISSQPPTKLLPLIEQQNHQFTHVQSKIISLVSSNQSTLHLHDEAAAVMQRYPNKDIAFVGIWGAENSDKSFFYDRILHLCDIEGDKYTNASIKAESKSQLYFFERPFIKNNIRIFLLDCRGYQNCHQLTKTQKHQLDLMLSICQTLILIEDINQCDNDDITQIGYQHLNDAFHRLYSDKKRKEEPPSEICWPRSLSVLYNNTNSIKKHQKSMQHEKQLCCMFRDYSFSILHKNNDNSQNQVKSYTSITNPPEQLYLKNTSIIFRDIYAKIDGKYYMNIKFNGFTIPHILTQQIHALSQHHHLYLPKAFNKAKKSVFLSIYNRHALGYLLKMKQYIGEQKPYSTDYLLNAFQNASDQITEQYNIVQNQVAVRPSQDSLCLQYEKKLEDYIQEKEKNILFVNSKKSAKQLTNILSTSSNDIMISTPISELKQIKNTIQPNRKFDNTTETLILANTLKQLCTKYPTLSKISNTKNINSNNEQMSNSQNMNRSSKELKEKKQLINEKKKQIELLNKQIVLQTNYQEEQNNVMNEIKNQQQKIRVIKTTLTSQISTNNNETTMKSLVSEIQQLKSRFNEKISQKNNLQQVLKNNTTSPQTQLLQQKLLKTKQQISNILHQSHQQGQGQAIRSSVRMAEKRFIDEKNGNIRRVNASKI